MARRHAIGFISLALLALFPACSKNELAERQEPLQLVPTPREMRRGNDQLLGDAAIVLPPGPSETIVAAAEEINLRLRELGAPALRVAALDLKSEIRNQKSEIPTGRRIELSIATRGETAPVPEAPQGYWLDTTDPALARIVGRDEAGLLWGAVTFRRLLYKAPDGAIALAAAKVRDWPDFPLRAMNRLASHHRERSERGLLDAVRRSGDEPSGYADTYVHDTKRVIDHLVRLKLNLAWLPLAGLPARLDELAAELGSEEQAELFLATLRRVADYARTRGVTLCDVLTTHAAAGPQDPDDPAAVRCIFHADQKKHYCWSLDERNRRAAEEAAKLLATAGYRLAALQLPNGGGTANPGRWSERCKDCRARWTTSRAEADAHLFAIWHAAFRKHAPDVALAAVQCPTDPALLIQQDHPSHEQVRDYLAALHKLLPNDPPVAVCVRESAGPAVAAFYNLFPGRPVVVQWLADATSGEHAWCPLYADRLSFARTFQRPGQAAWVLAESSSCAPLAAAAAAQYLWNAESPGAAGWPGDLSPDRDLADSGLKSEIRNPKSEIGAPDEALALLVAEAFGDKAAPCLLDAFRSCLSPAYSLMPGDVARLAETPNTAARMGQQYAGLVRASGGIERLWHRAETGEKQVVPPDADPYFCGLSEQVARSRLWAGYHAARLRAAEALRSGQPKAAIAAELRAAIARVKDDGAIAARMDARLANRAKTGRAELPHSLAKPLKARYDDTAYPRLADDLNRLLGVLDGKMIELREPVPETRAPSGAEIRNQKSKIRNEGWRPLLPSDPSSLTLRGKGSARPSLVAYPTQGESETSIQVEGLTLPWHDGFSVAFPPVDVADHARAGGVLRFYVNGGGAGNQQLTFWLYGDTGGTPVPPTPWPHVSLADYVAIDDLEATWQLVSVPLNRLLPTGYTQVTGFGMNNAAAGEVCGPLWIGPMYVAARTKPAEVEVPVQEPPEQPPATEARVLAVGVQPSTYLTADGLANRLILALKVIGNGTLSNVRIELRFLSPEGKLLHSHQAVAAKRIRTPWWSSSLRYDLGVLIPKAQVEMVLTSSEVKGTGSILIRW